MLYYKLNADGSGSMISPVGKTQIRCLDVANALAIYFSEHCSGQFKDKYITFSMSPEFVDFSNAQSLRDIVCVRLQRFQKTSLGSEYPASK